MSLCKTTLLALSLSVSVLFNALYSLTNIIFVVQLLEDEPFEALKPALDGLLCDNDKNKQRGAAELLAGLLGGQCIPKVLVYSTHQLSRFETLAGGKTKEAMGLVQTIYTEGVRTH